jgi:Zn ribbon nucleic-acid-binding protein
MHEHLSTAHVITGGKRPIQDTIVTAPIVPVGQEGQVAFSVGEIFPAYICPDCHARYVQITDSSGGFPACKCTTQGDLYQAGLGNAYGALQAYYGLADTVGDPEAVAASVKLVSADTSWDALTNPPAHSIDRDGQPKPGRAAELRERFIASLRAECPQCHKQIAIAEVIDKGGARHRVCPDCHYEFPPAIQRHIVNDNGRLVTASLPALDEQQAAVVRNALDHQRGQVTDTQTITGWSEAIRLLVEAGYMESTNKRVGAFMLTEKGKELSEHPGVRKLRAQAQATREREEERKAARAEAKAKRPPKPKAKKEAPTSLQPELQDIADEFTRLRYHVPRFAELQEGARWGVMYFAETWIDHEYTIDDLRVVQKYFESKDWLTCRPSTYVEQLQDARNWKTGRGSANDNQLRIAADTPEIISRPLDAGEVE